MEQPCMYVNMGVKRSVGTSAKPLTNLQDLYSWFEFPLHILNIFGIAGLIPEVPTLLLTPILTYNGKVMSPYQTCHFGHK